MNIERMRHQLDRTGSAADEAAWTRKLAAMTPEHRARHGRPLSLGICYECLNLSIAANSAQVRAGLDRMSQALSEQAKRRAARA